MLAWLLLTLQLSTPLYAPPFLEVGAPYTNISTLTRYPASGTYDVSTMKYLGGAIGLDPGGSVSHGTVTFYWTTDPAGTHIVGPLGISLNSLIVSLDQLRLVNQGPYLYITYQPFVGPNPLHANLFGTNVPSPLMEIPGDTILIDEQNHWLGANCAMAIYPDDYFAGEGRLYFAAPEGTAVTLYGADLTDQFWPLDSMGPGSRLTTLPLGTWLIVVSNPTPSAISYTVAVTPQLGGKEKRE